MIVYKYLDQKGAIKTINSNSVILKTPIEYNDPFDSLFFLNKKERNKAFKLFINYKLFRELYDQFVIKSKKAVRFKFYSKYIKQSVANIAKEVSKTCFYQIYPDISEFYAFASKILNRSDSSLRRDFNKVVDDVLDKFRRRVLVSCFGLRNDSILMWSHYGDSHKGACLEFEVDDKEFKQVRYSDDLTVFELTKAMGIIFGNEFNNKMIDTSDEPLLFMLEPVLTKSSAWSYENEVRCIFSKSNLDTRIHKKGTKKYLLEMPKIRKIYIGCNADNDFVEKIKSIKDNDVPVVIFKRSDEHYGIHE